MPEIHSDEMLHFQLGSLSCLGTEQILPLSLSLFLWPCMYPQALLCCSFTRSCFRKIKALGFAVWWAICAVFTRASRDSPRITTCHTVAAELLAQQIFNSYLQCFCHLIAQSEMSRERMEMKYGEEDSSSTGLWHPVTRRRLPRTRVYLVWYESISLPAWIRVKGCAATSALPALCCLSLCQFLWNTLMWKAPVMCALLIWHEYPMRVCARGGCLWCKWRFNSFKALNYSSASRLEMTGEQRLSAFCHFESSPHQSSLSTRGRAVKGQGKFAACWSVLVFSIS